MFSFLGKLIHGTRGFGNQIGKHLSVESYLNFEAEPQLSKMSNLQLKTLCIKLRNSNKKRGLLGKTYSSKLESISNMPNDFLDKNNLTLGSLVSVGSRAAFNNKSNLKAFVANAYFKNNISFQW